MKTKWNKNRYLSLSSCSIALLVISPTLLISCSNNNETETKPSSPVFSDQEIVNNYISSLKNLQLNLKKVVIKSTYLQKILIPKKW